MTFYVENEIDATFDFDIEDVAKRVIKGALDYEKCPYEVEVNLLITDSDSIKEYNRDYRNIDSATDVLSFPAVAYDAPCDFSIANEDPNSYFNPETGELILGDIILCKERILSQAEEYGHSVLREFSFLIVHSVLHLLGYDHMIEEEEKQMFEHQNAIMEVLGILR